MKAGLQIFNSKGKKVFDSTLGRKRLVRFIGKEYLNGRLRGSITIPEFKQGTPMFFVSNPPFGVLKFILNGRVISWFPINEVEVTSNDLNNTVIIYGIY